MRSLLETCEAGSTSAGDSITGISDLVGNVAEYVSDGAGYCLAGGYYGSNTAAALAGDTCVAFDSASLTDPGFELAQLGFRCVLPAN
jgi:hypothetical protein